MVALDAVTGELIWVHGEKEGARGAAAPRQLSGRGAAYWTDGKEARILYVTPGYQLIALDAKTGQRIASFGTNGAVDLKADDDQKIEPDLTTGEIGLHAAPTVVGDMVLVGSAFREGFTPVQLQEQQGFGARLRRAHRQAALAVPHHSAEGRAGRRNLAERLRRIHRQYRRLDADHRRSGGRIWPICRSNRRPPTSMAASVRATAFTATAWWRSIWRPASRKWHFQLIHHEIWDYDMSSAPLLMDINVDGKPIKAVAKPSKMGFLYVFDRITGKPVWPMPERKVEKGNVPGEWYSPTQPIPSKPAAYARTGASVGRADRLHARRCAPKAVDMVKNYKLGPIYTPPVVSPTPGPHRHLMPGRGQWRHQLAGRLFQSGNPHRLSSMACNACLSA